MKHILVTGVAGFIGFHTAKKLVMNNYSVIGIDNINNYYDTNLKLDRLNELGIDRKIAVKFHTKIKSCIRKIYFY